MKSYFGKNRNARESSTRCLREYCILPFVANRRRMLASPTTTTTDVANEDGCVKTRRADVNRANRIAAAAVRRSFFKRASTSPLSPDLATARRSRKNYHEQNFAPFRIKLSYIRLRASRILPVGLTFRKSGETVLLQLSHA